MHLDNMDLLPNPLLGGPLIPAIPTALAADA